MKNIFGKRLKELRKDRGLSMKQLSIQVGISDSCISRWENGQTIVNGDQLIMFAKFFNVSTDYLLGLESDKYPRRFRACPPFHEQLPILCEKLKTNKYQIQKKTGIAESAIYNWQNGTSSPNIETIIKIANAYGCSVDFVIGRSDV